MSIFFVCFVSAPFWMLQPVKHVNELHCAMQGRLRCDCRTWCVRWQVPVPYLWHHLMHSSSKRTMQHHLDISSVWFQKYTISIPVCLSQPLFGISQMEVLCLFLPATLPIRDRNQPTLAWHLKVGGSPCAAVPAVKFVARKIRRSAEQGTTGR